MNLLGWLPSRAALGAAITAFVVSLLALLAGVTRRNTELNTRLKDHENANDIEGRVAAGRAEFDSGVRPYANSGWRDKDQTRSD